MKSVLKKYFPKVEKDLLKIKQSHFTPLNGDKESKDFFSSSVKFVEVEVHSYCNRTCWFCPNSFIDRRSERHYLDTNIYHALLDDLAEIDYSGKISYSRYNEPFGDAIFYQRLKEASDRVPNALLHCNSNSDYINEETLTKAYDAGLRSLHLQIYLNKDEPFLAEDIRKRAKKILAKIPSVTYKLNEATRDTFKYKGHYRDMKIHLYARDFTINGTNRSGLDVVAPVHRTSPCLQPFGSVYIDYTGAVVPCCNIRSDNDKQEKYTLGKLAGKKGEIFKIFSGKNAVSWRKSLATFSSKAHPCDDCTFQTVEDNRANRSAVSQWEVYVERR